MADRIPAVSAADVERMIDRLYVTSGPQRARKWSAFWTLLVLAAVIATAGVIADSTATVIGAMIVAPLMTPILGTALAVVLGDHRHVVQNAALVAAAATTVVLIGYVMGLLHHGDLVAATNSQVAGRVSPGLIDLVGALATGAVGSFALVRSDVSDTLPGVAIAISLVPPLAVVGLTLESDAPGESLGALLLFGTNVAAIIATGTLVLLAFRVREAAKVAGIEVGEVTGRTLAVVIGAVVLVAVPLGLGTAAVLQEERLISTAQPVAEAWADQRGWTIKTIEFRQGVLRITALGPPPEADVIPLRDSLDAAGLNDVEADVTLIVGGTKRLPPG